MEVPCTAGVLTKWELLPFHANARESPPPILRGGENAFLRCGLAEPGVFRSGGKEEDRLQAPETRAMHVFFVPPFLVNISNKAPGRKTQNP
jgi:hypothetical protein